MPRGFAPCSQDELKNLVIQSVKNHEEWVNDWGDQDPTDEDIASFNFLTELTEQIQNDIRVSFCSENVSARADSADDDDAVFLGYHTMASGMPFLGVKAHGDWETPVYFIIYYDGEELRGYCPTPGNTWNLETMRATPADGYDASEDFDAMLKDIEDNIVPRASAPADPKPDEKSIQLGKMFRHSSREMARQQSIERFDSPLYYCETSIKEAIRDGRWKDASALIQEEMEDVEKAMAKEKAKRDALRDLKRQVKSGY